MLIHQELPLPKLHNFFEVKVVDTSTGETVQEARAENVVLDQIYHRVASNAGTYGGIDKLAYGDGTGAISASRTALFSEKGRPDLTGRSVVVTDDLVTISGKIVLAESAYVGGYIREVGLSLTASYASNYMLVSHALLEDSEGNPISIGPKTNTQIIEIYATIYIQRCTGMTKFPNRFSDHFTGTWGSGSTLYNPRVMPQGLALPAGTYDSATKTYTTGKLRIATGTGNTPGVFLGITSDVLSENIVFPDLDVFPKYTFLERQIGAGDGAQRAFAFTPGLVVPNSEIIKVAGVTKTRDVDYKIFQGGDTIPKHDPAFGLPYGSFDPPAVYRSNASKEKLEQLTFPTAYAQVIIDYGQEVPFKKARVERVPYAGETNITICGSLDGVTWDAPITASASYSSEKYTTITAPSHKSYRYLWVSSGISYDSFTSFMLYGGANVVFASPPANGAAITAQWDADVPPKDTLLFYDVQAAYTATW